MSSFSKVGVIGDVHAEDQHLERALLHLADAGAECLLCTGDVVDGTGDVERCVDLLKDYNVITVRGNHDRWMLEDRVRHIEDAHFVNELPNTTVQYLTELPLEASIDTGLGKLKLCHGVGRHDLRKIWPGTERLPVERCDHMDEIIEQGDYRLMINGHMHYRTLIHFEQLTLMNAGTLKNRHRPGFSMLDCSQGTVTSFEFVDEVSGREEVHAVKSTPLHPQEEHRVFKNTTEFDGDWAPVTLYA